jgi:large subunit ribosomal protein L2
MKRINKLISRCLQKGGRNNQGVITVWHRGGGNKKLYRIIDFKRSLFDIPATVLWVGYDPNRTSKIALISYKNGMLSYIIAPKDLKVGDKVEAGPKAEIWVGNALPLGSAPTGTIVHNIELKPGKGAQLIRAAGTHAKIIKKNKRLVILRLHSGKLFIISTQTMDTVGFVSNGNHATTKLRKAGQARWKNRKPVVRGVAMNPIDHPHGGGQGRSKGGGHPVTPWGKLTKGKPTRKKKKVNVA